MNTKRLLGMILCLCFVASAGCSGFFQQPAAVQGIEGTKVTVKGKIDYMKNFGGYYVTSDDPPGEYFIVNQNQKLLEQLFKNRKAITIDGHFTIGADHLFIERIDGQPYTGEK